MKAIVLRQFGAPEELRLEEVPRPTPRRGEALVKIRAVGVNFPETERRRGAYDPPVLPWIPGGEAAGVVEEVGEGASEEWAGKRVAFWAPAGRVSGSYAEYATVGTSYLWETPDSVTFEQAAALPLQGLTAFGATRKRADVRAGEIVVVRAAAGGVGRIVVQLALRRGARVIGAVSSEAKLEAVRALGAEAIVTDESFADRVLELTKGRGADVILDSVGRAAQEENFAVLAPFGRVVHYGDTSGACAPVDVERLYEKSASVSAFALNLDHAPELWSEARRELMGMLAEGDLSLVIFRAPALREAAEAHRLLESRSVVGKVILVPGKA